MKTIPNPLINPAVTASTLAGITGSASGGLSIALAALSEQFITNAKAAGIPLEVLHRIASMASGGMDTLPHNGAVITLLAVCGRRILFRCRIHRGEQCSRDGNLATLGKLAGR